MQTCVAQDAQIFAAATQPSLRKPQELAMLRTRLACLLIAVLRDPGNRGVVDQKVNPCEAFDASNICDSGLHTSKYDIRSVYSC